MKFLNENLPCNYITRKLYVSSDALVSKYSGPVNIRMPQAIIILFVFLNLRNWFQFSLLLKSENRVNRLKVPQNTKSLYRVHQ